MTGGGGAVTGAGRGRGAGRDADRDLDGRVREWLAGDPDPSDRAELRALPRPALAERFAAPLAFGTAGIRGPLRAGPAGMNTAVVVRTAAGLAAHLHALGEAGATVVVGRDARRRSGDFARAAAEVLAAAGFDVLAFDAPLPTPVTAFAVRELGAAAGVQITASHNPPGDNGCKVYLRGGAQLVPPDDAAIERAIAQAGPASAVPRRPVAAGDPRASRMVELYLRRASRVLAGPAGEPAAPLRIALTPLHGVGGDTAVEALRRAGFTDVHVVAGQFAPDPAFPTAPLPNPEEPGAAAQLLELAGRVGADVAIALDPDADRCALGVPDAGGWRMLRGDETGPLLAEHVLDPGVRRDPPLPDEPLVATTIVSSALLGRVAEARGARLATTLTGFKWLVRAGAGLGDPRLVYAYEEAIGICVDPQAVPDKDGVSAAVALCRMAARLAARGRTVSDALDGQARAYGVHAGAQVSVRLERGGLLAQLMRRLRDAPPATLGGLAVTCEDLAQRDDAMRTDALVLASAGGEAGGAAAGQEGLAGPAGARLRMVVRPSGTEPKVKAYLEVALPPGDDVAAARAAAGALLRRAEDDARRLLAG